jgi:hypothetical protein
MLRRSRFAGRSGWVVVETPAFRQLLAVTAGGPLLDFSDASHVWIVFGGVTWRTSDGGASWS